MKFSLFCGKKLSLVVVKGTGGQALPIWMPVDTVSHVISNRFALHNSIFFQV